MLSGPREILVEVVRGLTEADIPRLQAPLAATSVPIPIKSLRASHHQLAQLLVQGRPDAEVALITGYSIGRISILKSDPTFQELMAGYQEIRNQIFVDTMERMRILGLSTLDELQERLEQSPDKWSNRELMEMAELMLVKPKIATPMGQSLGGANTPGSGVTLNIKFVQSDTPQLIIDGKAEPTE